MKKIKSAQVVLGIALLGAALTFIAIPLTPASRTSAGGLPCFMCHGLEAQGSDIAPPLAGTQLTDEQILKQVRDPRGVMPAFPEFAQPFVVEWIRQQPTGQPTMTLVAEQRSSALGMIAAAASARATDILKSTARVSPAPTARPLATPSPTAIVSASLLSSPNTPELNSAGDSLVTLRGVLIGSALVLLALGGFRLVQRRQGIKN